MADVKISDLAALAAKPADDDLFVIVDVSEALAANKTKKITFAHAVKAYADEAVAAIVAAYPSVVPSARAYNDANISVANNSVQALTFNSERWDTDTIHSTTTNTGRLTATTAGIYGVFGHIRFASDTTGIRSVLIRLNDSVYIASQANHQSIAAVAELSVNTIYSLAATDYLELVVYQNSGDALNVEYVANYTPEFGMTYLGKAST